MQRLLLYLSQHCSPQSREYHELQTSRHLSSLTGVLRTVSKASSTSPLWAISLKASPREKRMAMVEMVAMQNSVQEVKNCLQVI